MSKNRKLTALPIVSTLLVVLLLAVLGTYVGAYFATIAYFEEDIDHYSHRVFRNRWQETFYFPLVKVESPIRREKVWPIVQLDD